MIECLDGLGKAGQAIGFVDDSPDNVAAARDHGWRAVQFEGEGDLGRIEDLMS